MWCFQLDGPGCPFPCSEDAAWCGNQLLYYCTCKSVIYSARLTSRIMLVGRWEVLVVVVEGVGGV